MRHKGENETFTKDKKRDDAKKKNVQQRHVLWKGTG